MPEYLRLYPLPTEPVEEIYGDLELPAEAPNGDSSKPYVYINMVSSLDGRVNVGGKAGGIGSRTDRETMRILRSKADAVMVGAGSLRAEKVSLTTDGRRSPNPLAVILGGSDGLPVEENLVDADRERTLILVSESVTDEEKDYLSQYANIHVYQSDQRGHANMAEVIRFLSKHFEVSRLLVEGGPNLNHSLISSGLAHELFLTLSPKLIGSHPDNISTILRGDHLPKDGALTSLLSVHIAEDELFLRYSLNASVSDK